MPAPSTIPDFVEVIQKSGVVDSSRLASYLQPLRDRNAVPQAPKQLAGLMVRDAVLTMFQAEQLLLGKWKRFNIGKYKVLERLGVGGMGTVFLCEHRLMRRRVAVKVLPSAKADDTAALERFYREARAVAALDHPNLVRAYDIDQDGTLNFLVMEFVDGLSLHEIVKKSGPLDPIRACHYVYQAALGLQYAFEVGEIVHRDIKPGNILVDRTGLVKILDMGLARFFNDEQDILTRKNDETVLGTADYLSPEQALDSHGVDIRADIYGLGATFYFMLTGSPPFAEGTIAQKLIWHQTREPKSVRKLRPEVAESIVAIVERMMKKDKADRYRTPADLAAALAPFVQTPIDPPADHEMLHLSPAAQAAGPNPNGSGIRSPLPRPSPVQPSAFVTTTPLPSPPRAVAAVAATCTPLPGYVGLSPSAQGEFNPYANLLRVPDAGPMSPVAEQIYATAVARLASPAAMLAEAPELTSGPEEERSNWSLSPIFAVVLIVGIGALVAWHFWLAPAQRPTPTHFQFVDPQQ